MKLTKENIYHSRNEKDYYLEICIHTTEMQENYYYWNYIEFVLCNECYVKLKNFLLFMT